MRSAGTAARASEAQRSKVAATSAASITGRMPRPPPPATALIIMAPPSPSAAKKAWASSTLVDPAVPGSTGTPHSSARARARPLSPNRASVSGVGPTKVRPASAQARAKAAFSERKP